MPQKKLDISTLQSGFAAGAADPHAVLDSVYERIHTLGVRPIWVELVPQHRARALLNSAIDRKQRGEALPLFGIPFAIKDNIDVQGVSTTAGCPDFAYVPLQDSEVVARLVAAGAIPIGKTNLDQFATGLVGTRSPYGACASVFNKQYISGGSSSGSALAVAHGLVSFSLGTDTAGSGRVPAAFNNLVGVKPTRGLLSTRGVVPACRTLDCVSIFANSVADAQQVFDVSRGFDAQDPFSRQAPAKPVESRRAFTFGVPRQDQLEFFGNTAYQQLYLEAILRCASAGGTLQEIDLSPFLSAAELLYAGPWVAERYAAVGEFIEQHSDAVNPIVRDIVLNSKSLTAHAAYSAQYALAALRREADATLARLDFILLPTAPTTYTLEEIERDPVGLNRNLGRYTNFVNLLDLAAVAVPAGFTREGLPFGVTLLASAWSDASLLHHAAAFLGEEVEGPSQEEPLVIPSAEMTPPTVPQPSEILLAVAGAHLSGQPLNSQLTNRGARLIKTCRTSAEYRLYALPGTTPPKPGVVFSPGFNGGGIEVEVWALSTEAFGSFVAEVPKPMTIGTATLDDGSRVKSFLCEPFALNGAQEITSYGGWRAFLSARI